MPTTRYPATVLLDTNILLRATSAGGALQQSSIDAMAKLRSAGTVLHICPQNMQEFRQVATRPVTSNGFGWASGDVEAAITAMEQNFALIPETSAVYQDWRRIVAATGAIGRANFDARLAAVAAAAGVSGVLTYESGNFARYAAHVPGLTILDPQAL